MKPTRVIVMQRSKRQSRAPGLSELEVLELLDKIPNTVVGAHGKHLRERALRQLQSIDSEQFEKVLKEYTRIPHTIEPLEMLKVKEEQRKLITGSVARARAAMEARIIAAQEAVDGKKLQNGVRRQLATLPKLQTHNINLQSAQLASPEDISSPDTMARLSVASSLSAACYQGDDEQGFASELSPQTTGTSVMDDEDEAKLLVNPTSAGGFSRLLHETTMANTVAPITSAVIKALTPPNSRATTSQNIDRPRSTTIGHPHPSMENPFACFLSIRSALPDGDTRAAEVRMCYDVHNEVQDRLRSIWRQRKRAVRAEQVAKEVWDQLPEKMFPVSLDFEGHLGQMRSLTKDQFIYLWVHKFWQRCKDEGW
jgi:hypothetical protein